MQFWRVLCREFESIVCVVIFTAMTLIGFINVMVRYFTDFSFAASEELLLNGFLILTIFGAAIAARRGEHLAVTLLVDSCPPAWRKAMTILAAIISLLLLSLSAWFCWQLVSNQIDSGIRSYGLQIPAWYYNAALPLGFALIIIRYFQYSIETIFYQPDDTLELVTPITTAQDTGAKHD